MSDVQNDGKTWTVVVLMAIANLLFSGIMFGWAPLQVLLEEDGVYRNLCQGQEAPCAAQTNRLVLIYTLALVFSNFASVLNGFLVDLFGPMWSILLAGVLTSSGLVLLGLSEEGSMNAFDVGYTLVGSGGYLLQLCCFPAVFLLPPCHRGLVMSVLTCLFNASPCVFLVMYRLYTAGLSRKMLMCGYAALCMALHLAVVAAWASGPIHKLHMTQQEEAEGATGGATSQDLQLEPEEEDRERGCTQQPQASDRDPHTETEPEGLSTFHIHVDVNQEKKGENVAYVSIEETSTVDSSEKGVGKSEVAVRLRLHGKSLMEQLRTFEFFFTMVHFCLQGVRCNTHLGLSKQLLEDYGDAQKGYFYTQLFALLLPVSALFAPFIGFMLKQGYSTSFLAIAFLGICWNVAALVPILPMQVLNFCAFALFRSFFFSAHFSYLTHTFGSRTSGSIQGLIKLAYVLLNFSIWPCKVLAERLFGGVGVVYWVVLLSAVPALAVVLQLKWRLRDLPIEDGRQV